MVVLAFSLHVIQLYSVRMPNLETIASSNLQKRLCWLDFHCIFSLASATVLIGFESSLPERVTQKCCVLQAQQQALSGFTVQSGAAGLTHSIPARAASAEGTALQPPFFPGRPTSLAAAAGARHSLSSGHQSSLIDQLFPSSQLNPSSRCSPVVQNANRHHGICPLGHAAVTLMQGSHSELRCVNSRDACLNVAVAPDAGQAEDRRSPSGSAGATPSRSPSPQPAAGGQAVEAAAAAQGPLLSGVPILLAQGQPAESPAPQAAAPQERGQPPQWQGRQAAEPAVAQPSAPQEPAREPEGQPPPPQSAAPPAGPKPPAPEVRVPPSIC